MASGAAQDPLGILGDLEVTLVRAEGVKNVSWSGRQNPYCVLRVGDQTFKSTVHKGGGVNPVWDQVFHFKKVLSIWDLRINLHDATWALRDAPIGACWLPLEEVCLRRSQDARLPVVTGSNFSGLTKQGVLICRLVFKRQHNSWLLPVHATKDWRQDYEPGRVLGTGSSAVTYLAHHKVTQERVAMKVIGKHKLQTREEKEDVMREVQVMQHLSGHPNIVALKDVYEDEKDVCLVMELCSGGELFDAIITRGKYREPDAAAIMHTIVGVVAHCHEKGIIHRDIKPENFLFTDMSSSAVLKLIDFNLSTFFQEGDVVRDMVGSAFYVAPEVLKRRYGKEVDLWSCGVVLYILLSGEPPFPGSNEKEIFKQVANKPIELTGPLWDRISAPAKDCVLRLLVRDPSKRATAADILSHEWLREDGCAGRNVHDLDVLVGMRQLNVSSKQQEQEKHEQGQRQDGLEPEGTPAQRPAEGTRHQAEGAQQGAVPDEGQPQPHTEQAQPPPSGDGHQHDEEAAGAPGRPLAPATPPQGTPVSTTAATTAGHAQLIDIVGTWPAEGLRTEQIQQLMRACAEQLQEANEGGRIWVERADLEYESHLDAGSVGMVCLYRWHGDQLVAVKWMKLLSSFHRREQVSAAKGFVREVHHLSRLAHPHIVQLHGITIDDQQGLGIVLEYVQQGSLAKVLATQGSSTTPQQRLRWAIEVASALQYLHACTPPVVHRDLKCDNILVDRQGYAKLTDFGISLELRQTYLPADTNPGTAGWAAPEAVLGACQIRGPRVLSTCTKECDVYSYGVLLGVLATNQQPWAGWGGLDIMWAMQQGTRLRPPEGIQPGLRDIIARCMDDKPAARPGLATVLDALHQLQPEGITPSGTWPEPGSE